MAKEREKRKRPIWAIVLLFVIVIVTIFAPPLIPVTGTLFVIILSET